MPAEHDKGSTRPKRYVTTTVEVEGRDETKVVEIPAFEPDPWGPDTTLTVVGASMVRVDAREKVTGRAIYTSDIVRPGMLHAVFVRATIARGRVASIDVAQAREMPGVVDVMTGSDLPPLPRPLRTGGVSLFDPNISYAGQPLAVVCAESLAEARRAADAVRVTYEAVPPVITTEQALATSPEHRRKSPRAVT
jgi:CO/xanthine dehydrogenase Mo-binding subunit